VAGALTQLLPTPLDVRHNAARQFDRTLNPSSVANIAAQGFLSSAPERRGGYELTTREGGNIVAILTRETPDLAHSQVKCREESDFENAGVASLERERERVIVSVFVQQAERIVVLTIEVQETRGAVGIAIGDFKIFWESNPARECCVNIS
jgi:hypothetical protein